MRTSEGGGKNNIEISTKCLMLLPPDKQPHMLRICNSNFLENIHDATERSSADLTDGLLKWVCNTG